MSVNPLHTQVGGKYSNDDSTVFQVKRRLQECGFTVTHPLADSIIADGDGTAFAFDPLIHSFKDVETDYYASIRSCAFHTVANLYHGAPYTGWSASLEVAYAMCFKRPLLVMAPLCPNDNVDDTIRKVVEIRSDKVRVLPELLNHDPEIIKAQIQSVMAEEVDYGLTAREYSAVIDAVNDLISSL